LLFIHVVYLYVIIFATLLPKKDNQEEAGEISAGVGIEEEERKRELTHKYVCV